MPQGITLDRMLLGKEPTETPHHSKEGQGKVSCRA